MDIEFYNGGTCIGSYKNAIVTVMGARRVLPSIGSTVSWYFYKIEVDGVIVDTIIGSESLVIKYKGRRYN